MNPASHDPAAGLCGAEQRLARQIAAGPVPPVPAEEIRAVCRMAAACCCPPQGAGTLGFWRVVWGCLRTRRGFLGAVGAFLLASGAVIRALCAQQGLDPLPLITALAPCPLLAFIIRELQTRDQNLCALEKTCKYSPREVMLAQLWVCMGLYALLLLRLGAAVLPGSAGPAGLIRLYACAFTALFLVGGAALLLLPCLSGGLPLSLLLAAWVLGASGLLTQPEVIDRIMGAAQGLMLSGAALSGAFFGAAAKNALKRRYA